MKTLNIWKVKPEDTVYRAEAHRQANNAIRIYELSYKVIRLTPKGFWLYDHRLTKMRWFSNNTNFVAPTPEEALYSLEARKKAHVGHAKKRLDLALLALKKVKSKLAAKDYLHCCSVCGRGEMIREPSDKTYYVPYRGGWSAVPTCFDIPTCNRCGARLITRALLGEMHAYFNAGGEPPCQSFLP